MCKISRKIFHKSINYSFLLNFLEFWLYCLHFSVSTKRKLIKCRNTALKRQYNNTKWVILVCFRLYCIIFMIMWPILSWITGNYQFGAQITVSLICSICFSKSDWHLVQNKPSLQQILPTNAAKFSKSFWKRTEWGYESS